MKSIRNGVIDYYFGLKFQTKLSYEKLVESIGKKVNLVVEEYHGSVRMVLQKDVEESINNLDLNASFKVKPMKDISEKNRNVAADLHNTIESLQIEPADKGFNLNYTTKVQKYFEQMKGRRAVAYEYSKKVYGEPYAQTQTRIILPPFAAVLSSGETVYLESTVYIFKNKSAVLRLTVPLRNVETQPLFKNDLDAYISTFADICGIGTTPSDNSIDSLKRCYYDFLIKANKRIKRLLSAGKIVSIIVTNHSEVIESIKQIPDSIKEDVYKILIAPVPRGEELDCLADVNNCFSHSSFTVGGTCSAFSKMNKCVTLIDKSIVEAGINLYGQEGVYDKLVEDIRNSVEFAFCILMLKKINNQYTFYTKGASPNKESEIQKEYYSDKIFISLMLSNTYGSVRDQVESFEENMKYFLDIQNTNDRLESINNILKQRNADRIQMLQNLLSAGALLFSVLFGLPAIKDTVDLLRSMLFFMENDIPVLTINNISFILWVLINGIIGFFMLYKGKKP